jgi:hypothetical protein
MDRARIAGPAGPGLLAVALVAAGCGRGAAQAGEGQRTPRRPPSAQGDADAPPAVLSYLQDDYERIFPERVRLARYGVVRYAASDVGDAAGDGDRSDQIDMGEAPVFVVIDQTRDRVRVIAPQDHYRLLLWLDVSDLYTVVTAPAALAADGSPARGSSGGPIRLHSGLPVEIDAERAGLAHIRHRDDCVSFSGWVGRAGLGSQFVPIQADEVQSTSVVGAGTPVFDRVGGREVARFLADCEVADTGAESEGHRPIRYSTAWFDLRGWVAAGSGKSANASAGGTSWGYGGLGHLGLWGARSRFRLTEGACLFARRGGPAIGVVTDDVDAPLTPPVDGWWQVPVETGWGDLTVWVAEAHDGSRSARARAPVVEDSDGEPTRPLLRRCR